MNLISKARKLSRRLRFKRLHQPNLRVGWVELGTDYGGWPVIPSRLPARPLVYSFGVGRDISFDLAMIDRFQAVVHAFDPTPRAIAWLDQQQLPANFVFHPIGIGGSDRSTHFFPPQNDDWDSFSNAPYPDQDAEPISADVCRLDTIMERLGHDRLDVLKMDVEGFEYEVVQSLSGIRALPDHLLVEFHHGMYQATDADTKQAVTRLQELGYDLFFVSNTGLEYGFVMGSGNST